MRSEYTGTLWGLMGVTVLQYLLTVLTLGIGAPWAICIKQRYLASRTVIDGQRLYFDGTGGALFCAYAWWFLLVILSLGIYGLWLNLKLRKWMIAHTHHV